MTVAGNGDETPTGATPTDKTYTFRKSCTTGCKKFWIYLGNAFENDQLYFAYENNDLMQAYYDQNGKRYRLMLRIELSYIRNPPT